MLAKKGKKVMLENKTLEKLVNDFVKIHGSYSYDEAVSLSYSTCGLSFIIATVKHDKQRRRNGEHYIVHPLRCYDTYIRCIHFKEEENNFDWEKLENEYDIPFRGVREVCLLHDVVEDTDMTMEELESLFDTIGYKAYFSNYIKKPLSLITHDKKEPYGDYIEKVMHHPISALVKIIDMYDNMSVLQVGTLDEDIIDKMQMYMKFSMIIDIVFKFSEKIKKCNAHLFKKTSFEFMN